jgi:hypothetical protein
VRIQESESGMADSIGHEPGVKLQADFSGHESGFIFRSMAEVDPHLHSRKSDLDSGQPV